MAKNRITPSINNLEILQNDHRNFSPSRLDLDFTELFLAKDPKSVKKRKQQKLVPTFEKEIKIKRTNRLKGPSSFSKDKTLPSFDDTEDKNSFTIRNKVPKKGRKPVGFPKEKTIIDSVYNTDFALIESSPVRRPAEIMKEIILIPSPHNMFKRLRRSKRLRRLKRLIARWSVTGHSTASLHRALLFFKSFFCGSGKILSAKIRRKITRKIRFWEARP